MQRGITYAAIAGAMWGFVFLAPALLPDFNPLLLSSGRYLLYGAVSAIILLPMAKELLPRISRYDWWMLIKLAFTGNILYYICLAFAVQLAGVATASLIIGVLPVTITLMGRKEADAIPLKRIILPLIVVTAGILCINIETLLSSQAANNSVTERALGIACAFGALFCWTHFAASNTRYLKQSPFTSSEWSSLWGAVTGAISIILWIVAMQIPEFKPAAQMPNERWIMFWCVNLGIAVLSSWFGNLMWNAATRRLPTSLGGQLIVFETLCALLYGFIYQQRLPSVMEAIAIILLVCGVLWTVRCHQ
ncbi:DMT family transporter [Pseudomonas sp. F1_0610]|uniref:DMT family transporter n=1 Tax=Pseudomonas sp. F1_0610 TaxID=3114284 RepID=UPI0039C0449C